MAEDANLLKHSHILLRLLDGRVETKFGSQERLTQMQSLNVSKLGHGCPRARKVSFLELSKDTHQKNVQGSHNLKPVV